MAKKNVPKISKPVPSKPTAGETLRWLPWALSGFAFLLFATGFNNGMVSMDDHSATVDNPAVTGFDVFGHFNLGMYAPVTWTVYAIVYALGKDSAFLFHLVSALVHALNVLLVFRLMRRLELDITPAAVVALLFAIHPIQVEAVSWIAAFSTPLFSLFNLLAMDYYLRSRQQQSTFNKDYWIAFACFLLACLAKSAAASLPLALLVLDVWQKRKIDLRNLIQKAPFFVAALCFGLLTIYSRQQAGHANTPTDFTLLDRALMVCHTIVFYWTKILFPFDLSIWYPFLKTNGSWPWTYYAAPLVLAGVYYLAARWRNQMPYLWYGLLFYGANIILALPYATFGTFELRSDRYNYLACIGIFAFLAMLPGYLKTNKPAWSGAVTTAIGLFCFIYVFGTFLRIRDWHDTITLIDKAIEASGDNFGKAYLWRGMEYGDKGKLGPAVQDFSKAIAINPALTEAYKYRGGLYGVAKQYEKSVADLNVYLDKNPNDAEYLFNRGLSQLNLNHFREAIADFSKTIEINPNFERAYVSRGNTYKQIGENEKGDADLKHYEQMTGQSSK